jgi:pSer/pThr/pTyr-binding forkhead associated (FHA) protein
MMDSFLKACGNPGPLQIGVRGPGSGDHSVKVLHQPFAIIGRDERADIVFDHKLLSRRHVYLQSVEGHICWIDLGSRTGTSCNGQLQKFGWLDPERPIQVGPFEFQWIAAGGGADGGAPLAPGPRISPLAARSHATEPLPEVALEFLNGPSQGTVWPMNRVMSLVGSADGSKFRLADPSVSPLHCSLLRTPQGLWVIDMLSADGLVVNDAPVRYTPLAEGDILKVGRYRIRIRSRFARRSDEREASDASSLRGEHASPAARPRLFGDAASVPAPRLQGRAVTDASPLREDPSGELLGRGPAPQLAGGPLAELRRTVPGASEPIPAEKMELAELVKGELAESVLVPLVNQFGVMQQQMLDQFQQAISMLVQMFGSLHRDQMSVIREELDQLRVLTNELHALKHEFAARSQLPPATAASERPGTADIGRSRLLEMIKQSVEPGPGLPATPQPQESPILPLPSLDESLSRAARQGPPEGAEDSKSGQDRPQDAAEDQPTEAPNRRPRPAAAGKVGRDSDRDVTLWLHQRMMALQKERETRWRRILKLLPGS